MPIFSSLADLVKHFESSGGNYSAANSTSSARGAYQFLTPTWRNFAAQTGVDINQYPTADTAPPAVQDAVFQTMVSQHGLADYTCDRCDPALTAYVNANPYVQGLPIFADGQQPGSTTTTIGADGQPLAPGEGDYGSGGNIPDTNITAPAGGTATASSASGASAPSATGLGAIGNWLQDKGVRTLLVVAGIALVIVATWGLVSGDINKEQVLAFAKGGE